MIPVVLLLAQTYVWYSAPSTRVCTPAPVEAVTVVWDAVPSPQQVSPVSGVVVPWTLTQYEVQVVTQRQATVRYLTGAETTVPITPPEVACVEIRAMGDVPVTDLPPPTQAISVPVNLRFVGGGPPPPTPAGWSTLTAPAALDARGYFWRIPQDPVSKGFLLYMGSPDSNSIYSKDIWTVNLRTGGFTKVIGQTGQTNAELCPSPPEATPTRNPAVGHPNGLMWVDPTAQVFYMTGPLCANYNGKVTSRLDLVTNVMLPPLATWPGDADGSVSIGMDSGFEFVGDRAILCCGDNAHATRVVEFNRSFGTYTDISPYVRGVDGAACDYDISYPNPISPHCPVLLVGAQTHSDGQRLWIVGGWNGAVGGLATVFTYDPLARVFTKLAPVGGVLPPAAHFGWPLSFFDSNRQRIVFLAQTGELWQYVLATNTWSFVSAAGESPVLNAEPYPGRACNFDAEVDRAVCVISEGQSKPPVVYVLTFSGAPR